MQVWLLSKVLPIGGLLFRHYSISENLTYIYIIAEINIMAYIYLETGSVQFKNMSLEQCFLPGYEACQTMTVK